MLTGRYDANNRITASPGKAWVYDGDGNPVSVNAGLGSEETFTHDAANRMRGYTNAASSTTASYLYDPLARRIRKTVNGTSTWFVWDGDHLLAEFDGSGDRGRRYTYTDGFAPVEQAVVSGPSSEDVQQVHADHLDTPRGLSGATGDAVWRAAYHAFGSTLPDEDPDADLSDVRFAIRFPGQFADLESSLHYNRYRYYSPGLGRYLSSDPLGQQPPGTRSQAGIRRPAGEMGGYVYAVNQPTIMLDVDGLRASCVYSQGTGRLVCWDPDTGKDLLEAKCYSGTGLGRDDPFWADLPFAGPTPAGHWKMGPGRRTRLGNPTIRLTPAPGGGGIDAPLRDLSTFLIHANNAANDASEGCMVCPKPARDAISAEGGGDLWVIP